MAPGLHHGEWYLGNLSYSEDFSLGSWRRGRKRCSWGDDTGETKPVDSRVKKMEHRRISSKFKGSEYTAFRCLRLNSLPQGSLWLLPSGDTTCLRAEGSSPAALCSSQEPLGNSISTNSHMVHKWYSGYSGLLKYKNIIFPIKLNSWWLFNNYLIEHNSFLCLYKIWVAISEVVKNQVFNKCLNSVKLVLKWNSAYRLNILANSVRDTVVSKPNIKNHLCT